MIRLLVDGVFFQLNNTGIARVWRSVLEILASDGRFKIFFLDRGNSPAIKGVEFIPFPAYQVQNCPADSQLIQKVCDGYSINIFTSTYYTTPISTPMVLMVYDMIPELFKFNMAERIWQEKTTTISYSQRFLCISENTRTDLLAIYPEIPPDFVTVAHCGVDANIFFERDATEVASFRKQHDLHRPYFLFVGSRVQHNGYKNSSLFFETVTSMSSAKFDIFCVGGEPIIESQLLSRLPIGVRCQRVELSDHELALAYGGAQALVYPSLYEGFGMPVIEAMASGCPVITTRHGSLAEVAASSALLIDGVSKEEMRLALIAVQDPHQHQILKEKGLVRAQDFRWEVMANALTAAIEILHADACAGSFDSFFTEWKRLRQMQANVDFAK